MGRRFGLCSALCGVVWCGTVTKGNGRDGVAREKMQARKTVCLSVRCVYGVCPLVHAALPCCGACRSPAAEEHALAAKRGNIVSCTVGTEGSLLCL